VEWIVTDDVYRETWRRLLEFTNIDLTVDAIVRRHGAPTSSSIEANYKKQAKQVRVSVLQAKEYFDAAISASLITSPNHVYYGAVAIASAMMLLLGDGSYSLDLLRKTPTNSQHGLNFSTGCSASRAGIGLCLTEQTFAEICRFGHFANWYATLPNYELIYILTRIASQTGAALISRVVGGQTSTPAIDALVGKKRSILDLMKFLPDLQEDFSRYGIEVPSSRSRYKVDEDIAGVRRHMWLLHGAQGATDLEAILNGFRIPSGYTDAISVNLLREDRSAIVTVTESRDVRFAFQFPCARDTMSHETITYAADFDTHEIADCYILAYVLSMLSRYYPDLWIACIESQCKAAKLIERSVETLTKKFPLLALSILFPSGIVISTHRDPGWDS